MEFLRIIRPVGTGQANPHVLECCGIRFTPEGFAAIESGRIVLTVYKADIRRIVLRRGLQAKHPVMQLIIGGLLFVAGLILVTLLILPEIGAAIELGVGGVFLLILGAWLLYESLRRGYFLHVDTATGWRKVAFPAKGEEVEIRTFLGTARDTLGYPIEADAGDAITGLR